MRIINKLRKWNPSNYAIFLFLLLPILFYTLKVFKLDNDFWFLINNGREIIHKGFFLVEPFTIHSELFYIPQQWLTTILFYSIYSFFGIYGMYILIIIMNLIIIYLFYRVSLIISERKNLSILCAIFLYLVLFFSSFLSTRPQIFDIIYFTLELGIIELFIKKNNSKVLWCLPIISCLLINLHAATWPMFFVFLLPYIVEFFWQKEKRFQLKKLVLPIILSFLVGFINPYHYHAVVYFLYSYGSYEINHLVKEMLSVTISFAPMVYIMIFLLGLSFYMNKGKNSLHCFLLFLGTSYLTLMHYRGFMMLIVSMVIILSYNLRGLFEKDKVMKLFKWEKIVYLGLIIILVLVIGLNMRVSKEEKLYPFVEYLDKHATKDIILYTGYNDGGYFEYYGYKCYIDPRAEVFLKKNNHQEDIMKEYYEVSAGKIDVKDFLEKYQFDYLFINKTEYFLYYYLKDNKDYEIVLSKDFRENQDIRDDYKIYYLFRRIESGKSS